MLATLIILATAWGRSAELRSCSGCKLNRLSDLRKFVKEEVSGYAGITVKFISGHNPELFIFDDAGLEIEKIDLTPYSLPDLHSLVRVLGFRPENEEL
jgi:Sep15/SelM redox domain